MVRGMGGLFLELGRFLWRLRWPLVLAAGIFGMLWVKDHVTLPARAPALPAAAALPEAQVRVRHAVAVPWTRTIKLIGRSAPPAPVPVVNPHGGVVTGVGVKVGDTVTEGQVVAMVAPQLKGALGPGAPVVSPVGGKVAYLRVKENDTIGDGVEVMGVTPARTLALVGDVDPAVAPFLRVGANVEATLANGMQAEATLVALEPLKRLLQTVTYRMTLVLRGLKDVPYGLVTTVAFPVGVVEVVPVPRASMDPSLTRVLTLLHGTWVSGTTPVSGTVVGVLPVETEDSNATTAWVRGLPRGAGVIVGSDRPLKVGQHVTIGLEE